MDQKIEPLNDEDLSRLEKMRVWVRDHYTEEARDRFEPFEGKIVLIDTILKNGWINADETWKLQSLGAVFGDALVQCLGLDWDGCRWRVISGDYSRSIRACAEASVGRNSRSTILRKPRDNFLPSFPDISSENDFSRMS